MKQTKCFLGAAALLMLASCSNENFDGPQEPNADGNVAYATLNISMANMGTRAGEDNLGTVGNDFQFGTNEENAVESVFAVFYDKAGKVIGTGNGMNLVPGTNNSNGDNVAKTVELQIMLTEGSSPADAVSVVAFVNYGSETADLATKTLPDLMSGSTVDNGKLTTTIGSTQYFKMTNSGYYDESGNYVLATDCDGAVYVENNGVKFPEQPREVDIYVERLAAKVELAAVKGIESQTVYAISAPTTPITLTFKPTKWDVTATTRKMYDVKNMPAETKYLSATPWMYTPTGKFRSYWAQSPEYNNNNQSLFPITSTDLPANPLLNYVNQGEAINDFEGKWTNEDKSWTPKDQTVNYTYVPENTFDASVLTGLKNPYTATTAIVIEGEYGNLPGGDKYKEGFYLRTINGTTFMYDADEAVEALVALAATNFSVGDDKESAQPITKEDVDFKPLAGAAANAYYIQLQEGKKYFTNISGKLEEVDNNATFNKSYFKDLIGSMNLYYGGKGFYYIPLKHYVTNNTTDALIKNIVTGNYGVVRNNWYSLTVNSISGFASGFGNPADQPDVDPDDPDPDPIPEVPTPDDVLKYGLNVSMKVLQWHMRNQTVDL